MFDEMLKSMDHRECGCNESLKQKKCSTSCDVLWMIILLMVILFSVKILCANSNAILVAKP